MTSNWSITTQDGVGVLRLDRPPENLLSFALLAELDDLLLAVSDDQAVRVVLLTGAVPGYFVGHADLDDVARLVDDAPAPDGALGGPEHWEIALERLGQITQPVVAAVDGQAWGGGCELALACQLRVASSTAHFRFVEVGAGAIPGAGGTQRLPRLVGPSRAAWMVLSGAVVDARTALAMGLVDAVLPSPDPVDPAIVGADGAGFLAAALEWVAPIARQPRHSLAAAKRALVDGARLPLAQGLAYEQRLFRDVLRSPQTRAMHAAP